MPTTYTLWLRTPGDNRRTAAGWGKPVAVQITAPPGDNATAIAAQIYDALRAARVELLCTRP